MLEDRRVRMDSIAGIVEIIYISHERVYYILVPEPGVKNCVQAGCCVWSCCNFERPLRGPYSMPERQL